MCTSMTQHNTTHTHNTTQHNTTHTQHNTAQLNAPHHTDDIANQHTQIMQGTEYKYHKQHPKDSDIYISKSMYIANMLTQITQAIEHKQHPRELKCFLFYLIF